jgi:hypothetical protein
MERNNNAAPCETPRLSAQHRVDMGGRMLAATCPALSSEQLRERFSQMFGLPADGQLYQLFRAAYKTERASMDEI